MALSLFETDYLASAKEQMRRERNEYFNRVAQEVRRARILKERTDTPIERVQAYEKWGEDQKELAALKTMLKMEESKCSP